MCAQTLHKQLMMSRQWFMLHSDRFHRKKCLRVIENELHQAANTLAHNVFSNSDTHFPWNRLKFTWNHCPGIRNCLWVVFGRIALSAILRNESKLRKCTHSMDEHIWYHFLNINNTKIFNCTDLKLCGDTMHSFKLMCLKFDADLISTLTSTVPQFWYMAKYNV